MHQDDLPIHEPCHADWNRMSGDDRRRFCGTCTKHVHDLSGMTRDEAKATLAHEPDPCVRYETDPEGRIVFLSRRRMLRRTALAAAIFVATPAAASTIPDADDSTLGRFVQRVVEWLYGAPADTAPAPPPPTEPAELAVDTGTPPKPKAMGRVLMGKPARPPIERTIRDAENEPVGSVVGARE